MVDFSTDSIATMTPTCPSSQPGFFIVNGQCLFYESILRNFEDAQTNCQTIFASLNIDGQLYEPRDLARYIQLLTKLTFIFLAVCSKMGTFQKSVWL